MRQKTTYTETIVDQSVDLTWYLGFVRTNILTFVHN